MASSFVYYNAKVSWNAHLPTLYPLEPGKVMQDDVWSGWKYLYIYYYYFFNLFSSNNSVPTSNFLLHIYEGANNMCC
jgi:hypothetical protein